MKKSDKLARKTRKMIAKNLIVLAVLATVAFAGVVSWFSNKTTATAGSVSAYTKVGDGLEFYIMPPSAMDQYADINNRLATNRNSNNGERTTWHTSSDGDVLFDTSTQEFKFMEGLFLCETTSDGITFQIPKLVQYDNVAYIDTTQNFDATTANDEYMSFDLYFRCKTTETAYYSVNMTSDSSITPSTTYQANSYVGEANYSDKKDAAIGAVRMSVLNMEANGEREMIWIPGPDVYYNGMPNVDTLTTGLTSSQYANKGAVYYTGNNNSPFALRSNEGTNTHAYYADKNTRTVVLPTAQNSPIVAGSTLGSDKTVITFNHVVGSGNDRYQYGHIRINLWIEGEDAEARLAFVGGKFSMNLNFKMT